MKVVTEAIDSGVQGMMAKLQSNENFDNLSSLGGMRSLVLKHTNEFQEGIQNHLIDYLKDVKSGKWVEIRLGKEFEAALAGASQEMSYYIIKVATENYVLPKPYEAFLFALKKDTALLVELEKLPARTWEFLKLAKESFTHAVPTEDHKTLLEVQEALAALERRIDAGEVREAAKDKKIDNLTRKLAEVCSVQGGTVSKENDKRLRISALDKLKGAGTSLDNNDWKKLLIAHLESLKFTIRPSRYDLFIIPPKTAKQSPVGMLTFAIDGMKYSFEKEFAVKKRNKETPLLCQRPQPR